MRIVGYIATAVAAVVVLGLVVVVLSSASDIRRYLRIRRM
ncbi:MAG: hypothetical protein V7637_1717 [Mycobacteriales bacterium]|jgi:hypothetical protein